MRWDWTARDSFDEQYPIPYAIPHAALNGRKGPPSDQSGCPDAREQPFSPKRLHPDRIVDDASNHVCFCFCICHVDCPSSSLLLFFFCVVFIPHVTFSFGVPYTVQYAMTP